MEPEDRILDACLEELLGGARPPDLSARILENWQARSAGDPQPPPLPSETPAEPSAVVPAPPRPRRRLRKQPAAAWWAAAVVAAAGIMGGMLALLPSFSSSPAPVAGSQEGATEKEKDDAPDQSTPDPSAAAQQAIAEGRPKSDEPDAQPAPFDEHPFGTGPPPAEEPSVEIASSHPQVPDEQVVAEVNRLLARSWRRAGVTTESATDEQWCRRAYLRLLGRVPTVEELQQFASSRQADKRSALVARLQSEEYADQYAAHWASYWTNVLIGRRGGADRSSPASRQGLEQYLAEAIRSDQPYHTVVRELIAATGAGRPGADDYNGAANFLLASLADDRAQLATARTFRVFHGRQVRCVQCHTHPLNDQWTQQQFWELNAFFRQAHVERGADGEPRLVNRDFAGEGEGDLAQAEIYYEMLNGLTVAAYPAFPGAEPLPASGRVEQFDRRAVLADLMSRDRQLSLAVVNRLWSHFHGYGFTRPVDDMGPHNPPSHAELLEHLAEQFEAGGYRLRRLTAWIALSDSFSRSSQIAPANLADAPEAGSRPLFSRYYTRQLQPEAVYDSLRMMARADAPRPDRRQDRQEWLGQFAHAMGTDEGEEMSSFRGDVRQSLIIMNGPLMRRATSAQNTDSLLHRVVHSQLSLDDKVEHLFQAAVARKPTRQERAAVSSLRARFPDDETSLLESVWWALLNSNEFILDH